MKDFKVASKKTIIIAAFIVNTINVFAQFPMQGVPGGGHNNGSKNAETPMHNPPYGGMVKEAGKYHIEMVVNMIQKEDKIMFYIMTGKGKMLPNTNITANITFIAIDGTMTTHSITAKGDDFFVAQLQDNGPFRCIVTFNVKNKKYSARFDHKGIGKPANEQGIIYTCSMHPEMESNTTGNCPKCGMDLKIKTH